ncbi:competence type IV pilus ATPase ComGA [Bacillaceae bacterium W0354]
MINPETISKTIITDAINRGTTDIHFTPNDESVAIHFRINGYRWFYKELPLKVYQLLLSYYKFNSGMDIAEKYIPQSGTLIFNFEKHAFHLRLSTLPTKLNESLAIRLLSTDFFPKLDELFLFPSQSERLMNWMEMPAGIILFTGPTGSGKTTSMYALIKEATEKHGFQAITLEDPVEHPINNLLQVQVNEKVGFDYHIGLKAALRHDPDLIMVGEIRDENTARFAFRAALTGHLVLSTVHARNAYGTIFRLKEMGINKVDMKESIIGICSQQLIAINQIERRKIRGRAAIAELLTGQYLLHAIDGIPPEKQMGFYSFERLRRKAHALGFTSLSS